MPKRLLSYAIIAAIATAAGLLALPVVDSLTSNQRVANHAERHSTYADRVNTELDKIQKLAESPAIDVSPEGWKRIDALYETANSQRETLLATYSDIRSELKRPRNRVAPRTWEFKATVIGRRDNPGARVSSDTGAVVINPPVGRYTATLDNLANDLTRCSLFLVWVQPEKGETAKYDPEVRKAGHEHEWVIDFEVTDPLSTIRLHAECVTAHPFTVRLTWTPK